MKTNRFWMAMAASCWVGCTVPVTTTDEPAMASESSLTDDDSSNPQLFGMDSHPYGISMKEWAFNWMRWVYSIPAATLPIASSGVAINTSSAPSTSFLPVPTTTTPSPCRATRR